jgi:hypothetical protein
MRKALITCSISLAVALAACDSGSSSGTGPTEPAAGPDTTFAGRWRIYALPSDTFVFASGGKGLMKVDLMSRVAVDSFTWSASALKIHFVHSDGKAEDGTYKFFTKDSFNMTLPSIGTQLYLRLK